MEFFEAKQHKLIPSASLLPSQDPTLLFIAAGMVPFKSYFSGLDTPPHPRLASIQKCLRTTDLDEVGKTKRHLSFFEMLGNFSFGDYFKKEAIEFAWEYSTQVLPFPKEEIWVTVYNDDHESFKIWKDHIGISEQRIKYLGREHNFWGPAGSTGPCGPCSELYIDRGSEYDPDGTCQAPGDEGERFLEFWNLVFNQYHKNENQEYLPLNQVGVDTGAGLERIASLLQGVDSVYETDELSSLRQTVEDVYKVSAKDHTMPLRIITDHLRSISFSIADGIYPSNLSRGYVLRRILRRAMLYSMKLGQKDPILHRLIDKVVSLYAPHYPELEEQKDRISNFVLQEEERFLSTLKTGSEKLGQVIEASKSKNIISGKDLFLLYDSYGFPIEMTQELADAEYLKLDIAGFEVEMEKQKEKGRQAWKGDSVHLPLSNLEISEFVGYEERQIKTSVSHILYQNKLKEVLSEKGMAPNETFYMVSKATPFYPEGGGQLGDKGILHGEGFQAEIIDTQKFDPIILHICSNLEGTIKIADEIYLEIDIARRECLEKNHSATHLLNAALKETLGAHIQQSGSLVHYEYLRFDFTHSQILSLQELENVESLINDSIASAEPVDLMVLPKEKAETLGAVMTFGEKYGEVVRVVKMGEFSMEFCGGTHVKNIAHIGCLLITKESSPGSGNRRIEAFSGNRALKEIENTLEQSSNLINNATTSIKETPLALQYQTELTQFKKINQDLNRRLQEIQPNSEKPKHLTKVWQSARKHKAQLQELEKNIRKGLKKTQIQSNVSDSDINIILESSPTDKTLPLYSASKVGWDISSLKQLADSLRNKRPDAIFSLHGFTDDEKNEGEKKWNIVLATTRSFAQEKSLDLGKLIKKVLDNLDAFQGGGGGKPELSQASGSFKKSSDPEDTSHQHYIDEFNRILLQNV